jgi:chorismate-pyruvate lyase
MRQEEPDLLAPLARLHGIGCGKFVFVDADKVPAPFQGLLVHNGDMTSRLEAFHGSKIGLEVLQSRKSGESEYSREVILRRDSDRAAVEYGAIEIFLGVFEPEMRERILEGRIPLGGLLNARGVRYHSEPRAFFQLTPGGDLAALMETSENVVLYGRCNVLKHDGGAVMARIVEVLPVHKKSGD